MNHKQNVLKKLHPTPKWLAQTLAQADCAVLTTNHYAFNVEFIQKHAKLIVDLRNMIAEKSEQLYEI